MLVSCTGLGVLTVYHTCTDNRFFGLSTLQTMHCYVANILLICIKLIVLSFLYEYDNFVFLALLLWTLHRWLEHHEYFLLIYVVYLLLCCVENKETLNPVRWPHCSLTVPVIQFSLIYVFIWVWIRWTFHEVIIVPVGTLLGMWWFIHVVKPATCQMKPKSPQKIYQHEIWKYLCILDDWCI